MPGAKELPKRSQSEQVAATQETESCLTVFVVIVSFLREGFAAQNKMRRRVIVIL